jgi:hypothetical protein
MPPPVLRQPPFLLHGACALLTLGLLLAGIPAAPTRALAGLYFAVVLVPALQAALWAFCGWKASLVLGAAVAALILGQTVLPPRSLVSQPARWSVSLTSADQVLHSRLVPPPGSRAPALLGARGAATLHVCRHQGDPEDLRIELGGARLTAVTARPSEWSCWLQLAVPSRLLPDPPAPLDVTLRPDPDRWPASAPRPSLAGGYTRPAAAGGQSGGGRFFDGQAWHGVDLAPFESGEQRGRYYVELRITDGGGRVREVWY